MGIHIGIEHRTTYRFDRLTTLHPARHPAASGAALPDPDPVVQPAGRTGRALHQLAAGPVRQLHGTAGVPRTHARARHHRRPRRRHDRRQPVRFLRRGVRRDVPVRVRAAAARRPRAVPQTVDARQPDVREVDVGCRAPCRLDTHRPTSSSRSTGASTTTSSTRSGWNPASRRRSRRSNARSARAATPAGCWSRRCAASDSPPGSCRATWCSSPPTRKRSTVRRGPPRTSPTCTPGPRCTCPGPAGSDSTRPRGSSPAKATSRSPARRTPRPRQPITGATSITHVDFAFANRGHPRSARTHGSRCRTPSPVGGDRPAGRDDRQQAGR